MLYMMFSSIYDLYLVDANGTHPSVVKIKHVSRHCHVSWEAKIALSRTSAKRVKTSLVLNVFLFKLLTDNTNLLSSAGSIYNLLTKGNYIGKSQTSMVSEWLKAWVLHLGSAISL